MKHKALLITVTCLIFCAICVLCFKELFSVRDITVQYTLATGNAEDVFDLLEKYRGKSIFSVDEDAIIEEITTNRYLKVVSVKKKYPSEIVVSLLERTEKFYYESADGVYFFDEEYFVVRKAQSADEKEGIIRIDFNTVLGDNVPVRCGLMERFEFPDKLNDAVDLCLSGVGNNISSFTAVSLIYTEEEGNYRIRLKTIEGVEIEIRKAASFTKDKATAGVKYYLSLEESRKIDGVIIVDADDLGVIGTSHTFNR